MKLLFVLTLILSMIVPAFASGPMPGEMPSNSNTGTSNMSPGREKWTRKRVNQLKRQKQIQKQQGTGPGIGTVIISKAQQYNNPLAVTAADEHKAAVKRRNLIAAIELLSLKKERGELSPEGKAKLAALINYYRTNYMSGY